MPLYSDAYCILQTGCIVSADLVEMCGPDGHGYAIAYILMLGHDSKRVTVEYPDKQTRDRAFSNLRMVMGVHELDTENEEL